MKNATIWSWRLWSLTIKSIEDHCGCLHGVKAGPEHSLDNHIYLRHSFYDLQQHLTDLQKPDKARGSRIRVLKCYQIKVILGSEKSSFNHSVTNIKLWAYGGKKWRLCTDSSSSMFCGCASMLRRALVILELPFPPIRLCSSCLAKEMSWGATNLLHLRRTWENYSLCVMIQGWTEFKSFHHMESNQNRCPYMTKHIQRSSKRGSTRPQRAVINGWMKTFLDMYSLLFLYSITTYE